MLDYNLLVALLAVEKKGQFEKAARSLGITASAVSQRIKLLEERVGAVLVQRGVPCVPTSVGARLCRHTEKVALLEGQLLDDVFQKPAGLHHKPAVDIAIHADSLSTWFMKVLEQETLTGRHFLPNLKIETHSQAIDWMHNGDVLAAITTRKATLQGFQRHELGSLSYIAVASPDFVRRNFPDGVTLASLESTTLLEFCSQDILRDRWIKTVVGRVVSPQTYILPSSMGFVDACLAGVGWGLYPCSLVDQYIKAGRLQPLVADLVVNQPIYWYYSRVIQDSLKAFSRTIQQVSRELLDPGVTRSVGRMDVAKAVCQIASTRTF